MRVYLGGGGGGGGGSVGSGEYSRSCTFCATEAIMEVLQCFAACDQTKIGKRLRGNSSVNVTVSERRVTE